MSTITFFNGEIRKTYPYCLVEKADGSLELWSTYNVKTAPLIRPLLSSTKGGLNKEFYCILQANSESPIRLHRCIGATWRSLLACNKTSFYLILYAHVIFKNWIPFTSLWDAVLIIKSVCVWPSKTVNARCKSHDQDYGDAPVGVCVFVISKWFSIRLLKTMVSCM